PPQTVVLLALLVEDPAVPPAGEGTFGHPVVRGPGDAALAQFGVLEEAADGVVAQDGQTVVGAGVPAAFAGLVHGGRGDREVRVGDVEVGSHVEGGARHWHSPTLVAVGGGPNTLNLEFDCQGFAQNPLPALLPAARTGVGRRAAEPARRRRPPPWSGRGPAVSPGAGRYVRAARARDQPLSRPTSPTATNSPTPARGVSGNREPTSQRGVFAAMTRRSGPTSTASWVVSRSAASRHGSKPCICRSAPATPRNTSSITGRANVNTYRSAPK